MQVWYNIASMRQDEARQFPVGAKVRIIYQGSDYFGREGVVTEVRNHGSQWRVHTDHDITGAAAGWSSVESLKRVDVLCPQCETKSVDEGDYLCHNCRYGIDV
jgi:hypothetical protein